MTANLDPIGELTLAPATRLLWRAPDSVQLELGDRAVVVDGLSPRVVRSLVGARPGPAPTHTEPSVRAALTELRDAGFLWPEPADGAATGEGPGADERRLPPAPRLAGELVSLTARHGERGAELLAARRHVSVAVQGTGRAAAHLAALLAAAGVGRVRCTSAGPARLRDAVPGGLLPADEGREFAAAAADAIRRAAPETAPDGPPAGVPADLTVLVVDAPVDEMRRASLHAAGAAHLVVAIGIDHGSVGPLVVPGLTSCLRCADLHRRDRDPLWPVLAAQLTVAPRHGAAGDVAVSSLVVSAAAIQVLTYLDGGDPACLDGSLELRLPDWRLRRRTRAVHTDCDCADDG